MSECIFCRIVAGEAPASFAHRDELVSAFLDSRPVTPGHLLVIPNHAQTMRLPAPADLVGSPPEDLLALYAKIIDELIDQKVVRSSNNPVADYSEYLTARAFGLTLVANATIGFDAISADDVRYQVKARRLTARNGSRQLGFIRGLDKEEDPFDLLVGILFDSDFTVLRAALIPIEVIRANAARVDYVNGWRFILRESVWVLPGVEDATDAIRAAVAAPAAAPTWCRWSSPSRPSPRWQTRPGAVPSSGTRPRAPSGPAPEAGRSRSLPATTISSSRPRPAGRAACSPPSSCGWRSSSGRALASYS